MLQVFVDHIWTADEDHVTNVRSFISVCFREKLRRVDHLSVVQTQFVPQFTFGLIFHHSVRYDKKEKYLNIYYIKIYIYSICIYVYISANTSITPSNRKRLDANPR